MKYFTPEKFNEIIGGEDFDPTRPLVIDKHLELGCEAAATAESIRNGTLSPSNVFLEPHSFHCPIYYSVSHKTDGGIEMFGFPEKFQGSLPTDLEKALVKAIAGCGSNEEFQSIIRGNYKIILYNTDPYKYFFNIVIAALSSEHKYLTVFDNINSVEIDPTNEKWEDTANSCLMSSYATTPLKFRFLELYRVIESFFLFRVKKDLLDNFDEQPSTTLQNALDQLKSEHKQITILSNLYEDSFSNVLENLNALKKEGNEFTIAIFEKLKNKSKLGKNKSQNGAALIYQIRCAVVHAGAKDIIFDHFKDGDDAINSIISSMEKIALDILKIKFI